MGLPVEVYTGEFGGKGPLSRAKGLVLVNVSGPFEPSPDRPAALLLHGYAPSLARVVPAVKARDGEWHAIGRPMMNGAYAATSDSRFSEAVALIIGAPFHGAVGIFDRYEDHPRADAMLKVEDIRRNDRDFLTPETLEAYGVERELAEQVLEELGYYEPVET
jgi:hypothetical protein